MQIKRDYEKPFFRERRKGHPLRRFALILLIIVGLTALIINRPEPVINAALQLLGPEMTPTPQPFELAQQANDLYWEGDLQGAVDLLERAVNDSPDAIDYRYNYGMLLIDLDDPERAEEIAAEILEINPNDPRGYALRARALVWQDNSSGAIPVATAGLDLAPNFSPLHAALARAYLGEGQLREAQEAGLRAIELDNNDVRAYWAYATALSGSGARDEAIVELERTIDVHPRFTPPYFELAFLYLASNRDQEAIDTYDFILGMQPRNARALLRQCLAYRKVGQLPRAKGLCQDAVDSDPTLPEAQFWLGVLRYRDFEFEAARDAFQQCVELDPANLTCTYQLGLSYYYISRDTYRLMCESNRDALTCESYEQCQMGWDYLQEALFMTQSRTDADDTVAVIREGLNAIAGDAACQGVAGNRPTLPTPTPDTQNQA